MSTTTSDRQSGYNSLSGHRKRRRDALNGDNIEEDMGKTEAKRQHNGEGEELPGPRIGDGRKWSLRGAVERSTGKRGEEGAVSAEMRVLRKRGAVMLEEALKCGHLVDMVFELDDGSKTVGGHRAVLSCGSKEFERMFRSGMKEGKEGVVRMRGVGPSAVKGLLEWMYLGRPGEECRSADGRELWLLGEMYEVEGVMDWLLEEAVEEAGSLFGAYEFGLLPEGYREALRETCLMRASKGILNVSDEDVLDVGPEALMGLVKAMVGKKMGKTRTQVVTRDAFSLVERWWRVNGRWEWCSREAMEGIVELLDLRKLSSKDIREIVQPSGLVTDESLLETRGVADNGVVEYVATASYGSTGSGGGQFVYTSAIAVHGEGPEQILAAADITRVHLFNVVSGECVSTVGSEGKGEGQFCNITGLAFNKKGELFVSDGELHRIQVFDRGGTLLRSIGEPGLPGHVLGRFNEPRGLAITAWGDLLVADHENNRVQVFREDGTYVRIIGAQLIGEGKLFGPVDLAVAEDGKTYVVDNGNDLVQVFDREGRFLGELGSKEEGSPDHFLHNVGIAVGLDGEVFVSDCEMDRVQVFSRDGVFLQSIGCKGSGLLEPQGIAVDGDGRLFVALFEDCKIQRLD